MPYVNIKVTRKGVTREQKSKIIQGVSQVLNDVLGEGPAAAVIVIDEVDAENWNLPEPPPDRRRRGKV